MFQMTESYDLLDDVDDISWSDIFRPQTRRVSQTIEFRYREIEGRLCTK
jgi:hypothetical protein